MQLSSKLSTSLWFVIIILLMVQGLMGFYAGHGIIRTCTSSRSKENRRCVLRSTCSGTHLYPWPDALSKLPVAGAEYISVTKNQCFETTRTGIRKSITELLNHHNGRFIWLQGSPGSGKTAIAKSIADSLARDKRLAASFFWDKTGSRVNANSLELFPSTLASQLAMFSRDYEALLVNRLLDRSSRNVLRLPLEKRMDLLIIEPMGSISQMFSSMGGRPVVVLDGLDECGDGEMV